MKAGCYNLVERDKYPEFEARMSIVQFLRKLKEEARLPRELTVLGFDTLLYGCEEDGRDDLMRRIRRILMAAASQLFRQNPTIQFVLEGKIERALAIEIKLRDQYIELTPIFGNRLEQEDVDWIWAPFNL